MKYQNRWRYEDQPSSFDVTRKRSPGEQSCRCKWFSATTEIEDNESDRVVEIIEKNRCTYKYSTGSKLLIKVFKLELLM